MKVLSLFDGISCGMVALERAGIPVEKYVAYEIDENAIKVSRHNYPNIEQKGDVFKATYAPGEFDILIGGSPCTYWSIAKAGYGRETTSSGLGFELFMQYVRALKEARPKYFLYENNFGMSDEIKNEITKQLGVEPVMIDSADFSAQHRKRLYWTNIPISDYWEKSPLLFEDIMQHDVEHSSRNFEIGPFTSWHLTATEMERLQTLPDGYTSCLGSALKTMRVVGNGWTVDVIAWILSHIPKERPKSNVSKWLDDLLGGCL